MDRELVRLRIKYLEDMAKTYELLIMGVLVIIAISWVLLDGADRVVYITMFLPIPLSLGGFQAYRLRRYSNSLRVKYLKEKPSPSAYLPLVLTLILWIIAILAALYKLLGG
ncbi:MAG: hypothetical protein F7B17_04255 [Desulfurococcales archaeon]|nr:hypothetical protein [Desulfurococcales archaeon]